MTRQLISLVIIAVGVAGLIVASKKFPNEDDHLHSIRNVESEEAVKTRGAIYRKAETKKALLVLSGASIVIGLIVSQAH